MQRRQRGITLIGLMFWAILIGFVAYVGVRVLPTLNEYWTIVRTINKIVDSPPSTVAEVKAAFERQKEIEYSITSISAKDLTVTKENERLVIGFAYDKEIPLAGPVSLLIHFDGRAHSR